MAELPGRSTQSIMAVKAEMVVVTIINILEKFDEDELALMMNDHKQDWEGHEMKSESPKQQQQVQKVNRQVFGNNSAAFPEKFLFSLPEPWYGLILCQCNFDLTIIRDCCNFKHLTL